MNKPSPWEPRPEDGGEGPDGPQPGGQGPRWKLALIVFAGLVLAYFLFKSAFPEVSTSNYEDNFALSRIILVAAIASSLLLYRSESLGQLGRYAAMWVGIFCVIAIGYSFYSGDKGSFGDRTLSGFAPRNAIETDEGWMISRGEDGHFHLVAEVEDVSITFLIDTGASNVVLTKRDAARIGLNVSELEFTGMSSTANGLVAMAPIRLESLKIGSLELKNLRASVNDGQMDQSLLGLSALDQLSGYEVQGDQLILKP